MSTEENMSDIAKLNGKVNGMEAKTPFLIGVAGGTASGKVKNQVDCGNV